MKKAVETMKKISSGPNIYDVAKHAGVSIATVSRVLNNADYPVSNELKKRVFLAAKELNYSPNFLAKFLKSNLIPAIGVVVPTLQNPFFNQVILGVESAARQRDYEVIVFSSHRSLEQERKNILTMIQNRVMAMIISSIDSSPDTLKDYIDCGGKVAMLESNFELPGAIKANTDYQSAGLMAVEHLVSEGPRQIAFLTAPLTKSYRRQILSGIKSGAEKYSLPFSDRDIFTYESEKDLDNGLYEFEIGRHLANSFLKVHTRYSAIIAINDITAFGIIQALNQNNIAVPEQVSVISFDNITYSGMIYPPLTTIDLNASSIGATVSKILIDSLGESGSISPDISINFPFRLEKRQSVSNLKKVAYGSEHM